MSPDWSYASVDEDAGGMVALHSTRSPPSPKVMKAKNFLETLKTYPNQSLWENMTVKDDGESIHTALQAGSLILVHDGSYQEDMDPTRCSAAYIVMCKLTGKQMQGTVVEKSHAAGNYRAELLGALCCLLVVKAASESGSSRGNCKGYCDNKGVVLHCAHSTRKDKIKIKQSQDDLVRLCKELLSEMPINVTYHHVKGHMDDILQRDQLTLEELLNIEVDEMADVALRQAVRENACIEPDLPYEQIKLIEKGAKEKAIGSIATSLSKWRGRRMCRNLFANRKRLGSKISWAAYDRVYWDSVKQAMKSFPRLFCNWVTKQVSGMCGCTSARAHWVKDLVDECPSCGKKGDSSTHVTRC